MKNEPLLTFVIPVYNVEPYVARCLNSILNQSVDGSEYEIIVYNDGSTDKSMEVVESIIGGRNNCITFSSEGNCGPSVARNTGVRHAAGRYIWFVDSDDYIEDGCLSGILDTISQGDVDVFNIGFANDNGNGAGPKSPVSALDRYGHFSTPWSHIFKREFLVSHELCFIEGILHEDLEFVPRVLFLAQKVVNLDICPYIVFKRPNSITTTVNPKKSFDLIVVAQSLYDFQDAHSAEGCDFNYLVALALNNSLQNTRLKGFGAENEQKLNNLFVANRHLFSALWKSGKPKYMLEYVLFSLLPSKAVGIFKFLKKFA